MVLLFEQIVFEHRGEYVVGHERRVRGARVAARAARHQQVAARARARLRAQRHQRTTT